MTDYAKIDALKKELEDLLPMNEEHQRKLDEKLRLEFNYNSNHMEGNTLTYGETKLALIFGQTTGHHELREYNEMKAHDVAYKYIQELAHDMERPLSELLIKELNQIILVEPFYKEAVTPDGQNVQRLIEIGSYKSHPNNVRLPNGEIFQFASPEETPGKMHDLIQWYRNNKDDLHPLELATLFHYKLVRIHPFDDGNGRVARLAMNYILMEHFLPPVVIKSADRKNYYRVLREADVGNLKPILSFIKDQLVWSLNLSIQAAKGIDISEVEDLDKQIDQFVKLQEMRHEVEISKNPKSVYLVYVNGISEFIERLMIRIVKFERLFENIRTQYVISYGSYKTDDQNIEKELYDRMQREEPPFSSADQVSITTQFYSFIPSRKNRYAYTLEILIDFNTDEYVLRTKDKVLVQKRYNEYLDDREIHDSVKYVLEGLLKEFQEFG